MFSTGFPHAGVRHERHAHEEQDRRRARPKPKPDWDEIFALSKKIARISGDYEWELGKAMRGIG